MPHFQDVSISSVKASGAQIRLFLHPKQKKRASGEYARISCVSERTSGRPSPVSAAKDDTTDENGDKHIQL